MMGYRYLVHPRVLREGKELEDLREAGSASIWLEVSRELDLAEDDSIQLIRIQQPEEGGFGN